MNQDILQRFLKTYMNEQKSELLEKKSELLTKMEIFDNNHG